MTRPLDAPPRSLALAGLALLSLALAPAGPAQARFRRTEPVAPAVAAPAANWSDKPRGTIILAVSLADQRLTIWDDGVVVGRSMVSTGVPGHETPRGVFTLLQKQRMHRSNIYSNAPMPFMQRITWSGVALHQGHVTGRPASHGCIRLPADVAKKLFSYTKIGARVIITDEPVTPADFAHPRLFSLPPPAPAMAAPLPEPVPAPVAAAPAPGIGAAPDDQIARVQFASLPGGEAAMPPLPDLTSPPRTQPEPSPMPQAEAPRRQPTGHVSIFISGKERKLFIRQGFEPVYESPVEIPAGAALGAHLFTAMEVNQKDGIVRWSRVSLTAGGAGAAEALEKIQIPEEARLEVGRRLSAGASLLISDQGLGRETGKTATDFILLTP